MSRVVARGRFRVDRRRALEKMERFQLEDPLRYVLEWVAAAVVAGAERIDLRNDSDDTELWWSGTELSQDDLDHLFDHLFGRPTDARAALLQHLGVGVLGALGRSPRWLHVDSGGWRLDVDDPAAIEAIGLEQPFEGVRCHVRDRMTRETMVEALLLAFRDPAEARLVQGAARWCPVPIHINDRPLPPPVVPTDAVLSLVEADLGLWLVPGDADGPGVDLVRHGIVVHTLSRPLGPCRVEGWLRADGVRLNASRSAVVDGDLAPVEEALDARVQAWLRAALPTAWPQDREVVHRWGGRPAPGPRREATRGELLDALTREVLARAGATPGALARLPVIPDRSGRGWSIEALAGRDVGWCTAPDLAVAAPPGMVVVDASMAPALVSLPQARDVTEQLAIAHRVAERRAQLAEEAVLPWAVGPRPPQHTGQVGPWRIGLSFDGTRREGVRLELRTEGRRLGTTKRDGIGFAVQGVVDGPFELGGRDAVVQHDAAFDAAMDAVEAELWAWLVAGLGPDATAIDRLCAVLHAWLPERTDGKGASRAVHERLRALPAGVGEVALWSLRGERVSTVALFAGAPPRFVVETVPVGCPDDLRAEALRVPARWVHRVGSWLGVEAPGDAALAKAVRVAHRLRGPRQEARLVPPPAHRVVHARDGLEGELGRVRVGRRVVDRLEHRLGAGGIEVRSGVRVLWQGLEVGQVPVPALLDIQGVVEGPELDLDDELRLTDGARKAVERWVEQASRALVPQLWDAVPDGQPLPEDLLRWLARFGGTLPGPERDRPALQRVAGPPLTLGDVLRLDRRKKGQRKLVVLSRPPGDLVGFEDAVVATGAARALLEALSRRGWRDGDDDVAQARDLHRRFVQQPPLPRPERPLWARSFTDEGLALELFLPRSPAVCGRLEVVALHRGRSLAQRSSSTEPGLLLWVEGLAPNRRCTDVEEGPRLTALKRRAAAELPDAVRAVLSGPLDEAARRALRRLAVRVKSAAKRDRSWRKLARELGHAPLLETLDGRWDSVAAVQGRLAAGQPVARVRRDARQGPTDHDGYLVDDVAVSDLVQAWCGQRLSDGTAQLTTWREGERRRREAVRVRPRRHGPHVRALKGEGLEGWLSLGVGQEELWIDPIADGVDLEAFGRAFPVRAVASVAGEAVAAAPDWRVVADADALAQRVERLVTASLDQGVLGGELPEAMALAWVAWRGPGTPVAEVPVFLRVEGQRASLDTLVRRGEVGFVERVPPTLPEGVDAVVLPSASLRRALARHLTLVDHRGLQRRLVASLPRPSRLEGPGLQRVPGGQVWAQSAPEPRVLVLHGARPVGWIASPPGVPLVGCVRDDAVPPAPDGEALPEGSAREAVEARLRGWERAIAERLVHALPAEGSRQLLEEAVVRLLRAEGVRGLRAHPVGRAPLLRDTTGARGSWVDALADVPLAWAPPGTEGLPDSGRVWLVPPACREALEGRHRLEDARQALALAAKRRVRLRERAFQRPAVPADAVTGRIGEVRFALWRGRPGRDAIALVTQGAHLGDLDLGGTGLVGFVEGPLPTSADLEAVDLPKAVRERVTEAGVALWQQRWEADPQGFTLDRRGRGPLDQGLLARVVVAEDGRGRGVRLGALAKAESLPAWSTEGGERSGMLVGPSARRDPLEALLGRRFARPDALTRARDLEAVAREVRRLVGHRPSELGPVLERLPPPLGAAIDTPRGRILAAWWVASRCVDATEELALVENVAASLANA